MPDFETELLTAQAKTRNLASNSQLVLQPCDLEELRDTKKCGVVGCSNQKYTDYQSCGSAITAYPWKTTGAAKYTNLSVCCQEPDHSLEKQIKDKLSGGAIAGIVIGVIAGLVVIIGITTCCIRRSKARA